MQGTSGIRGRGAWLAALAFAAALALPGAVSAQRGTPRQLAFDIAPQALPDALAEFARQAGVQVSAHGDLVRGVSSAGVRGTMSVDAALARQLAAPL
jgi:hemoglobin/transferrin/lactoferrin receptor protein